MVGETNGYEKVVVVKSGNGERFNIVCTVYSKHLKGSFVLYGIW